MQGGDNGTPMQKDEPQAPNPPNGAAIDYYLKTAATGPVTLEIQDAAGACLAAVHERSGVGAGVRRGGGWTRRRVRSRRRRRHSEHVGAVASGARAVRDQRRHAPRHLGARLAAAVVADAAACAAPPAGPFTAKLTVNGQTYTQTFDVKPDPRMK